MATGLSLNPVAIFFQFFCRFTSADIPGKSHTSITSSFRKCKRTTLAAGTAALRPGAGVGCARWKPGLSRVNRRIGSGARQLEHAVVTICKGEAFAFLGSGSPAAFCECFAPTENRWRWRSRAASMPVNKKVAVPEGNVVLFAKAVHEAHNQVKSLTKSTYTFLQL